MGCRVLARKAVLAVEPIDLAGHGDGALLDAAMAFVEVAMGVDCAWRGVGEQAFDFGPEDRLVGFDGE